MPNVPWEAKSDPKISPADIQNLGFGVAWEIKLANEPTTPVTLDRYIGYRGFRALALMGSSTGNIVGVDTDLGRVEWQRGCCRKSGARRLHGVFPKA